MKLKFKKLHKDAATPTKAHPTDTERGTGGFGSTEKNPEAYSKSFEELKINDIFTTATGDWKVYDRGTHTLLAYKVSYPIYDQPGNCLDIEYNLEIFFNYEFPNKE